MDMIIDLWFEQVEQIITDPEEARNTGAKGAKNPDPAVVVFTDQNGKKVAHKPQTLTDLDKE